MNLLQLITKMFEYKYFGTIIIAVSIALVLLFIIVLIVGLKDARKKEEVIEEIEKIDEDITMEEVKEELIIKEEITLEMPSITADLENFKKTIEEEIQKENINTKVEVIEGNNAPLVDTTKPVKILNMNEIEDTVIIETNVKKEPIIKEEKEIEEYVELIEIEEEPVSTIKEEPVVEVAELNLPYLAPDEDDELLFKTMTAIQLP